MKDLVEDNQEYLEIVEDILDHQEFKKLNQCRHHLSNRYDHNLRVSYWSYKITKALRLDYESVARAGLLHDFFFTEEKDNKKEAFSTLFRHSEYSIVNSKKYFKLNDLEEDIISTHMFPFSFKVPLYIESWIVTVVDDMAAVVELASARKQQFKLAFNLMLLFLVNTIK